MKPVTKVIIVAVCLSLIAAYFVPVWKINLDAPQYPEGLGMKIWINKLSGDIRTINSLNHYIGMKEIHAESIPELKYMPYILGVIISLGLLTAATGRKWLLHIWVVVFVVAGIVGGIDFYLWEYDYGHNLDPQAAIKIPDMSYQPPLLGSKALLNFIAHSYPDAGGMILIISGAIAVGLSLFSLAGTGIKNINNTTPSHQYGGRKSLSFPVVLILIVTMWSCTAKPQSINFGIDDCDHCKMKIADERFGSEIVTKKGKVFKFDAVECMFNYMYALPDARQKDIKIMLVVDAANPKSLTHAGTAKYLVSEHFPSPMGANLSAFHTPADVKKYASEYPGEIMTFDQAFQYVQKNYALK